jgi:hypothetical protein
VNTPQSKAMAVPRRPRRAALNWVDYLVIAATVLVFAAVVVANKPHGARAQSRSTLILASELPAQTAALGGPQGMLKARIGLALAGR